LQESFSSFSPPENFVFAMPPVWRHESNYIIATNQDGRNLILAFLWNSQESNAEIWRICFAIL